MSTWLAGVTVSAVVLVAAWLEDQPLALMVAAAGLLLFVFYARPKDFQ